MSLRSTLLLALSAAAASATTLFVSDYNGKVTTLNLSQSNGDYTLSKTHSNNQCAPNPSWLTLDYNKGLLYCINEGLNTDNGSITSFQINGDGSLKHIQITTTLNGPVNGNFYGTANGQQALVTADYGASGVSSFLLNGGGTFTHNQDLIFHNKPGPDPDQQDAPHPHEAVVDPTGQYIVVPDLGADLVRVFSWDAKTLKLNKLTSLQAPAGSGPRHAAFFTPDNGATYYLFLVSELASTVTGYKVTYLANNAGLSFAQTYKSSTFGSQPQPQYNKPAEVHVSPDNKFLAISNRNDSSFSVTLANGTKIASDSMSTFKINNDGTLAFTQLTAAYGLFPRQFSINRAGTLVAVGLQNSYSVAILQRDVSTGKIGKAIAQIDIPGMVTCVVWNEGPSDTVGSHRREDM